MDSTYYTVVTYACDHNHVHGSMCQPVVKAYPKPTLPVWSPSYAGDGPVLHNGEPFVCTGRMWKRISWEQAAALVTPDAESETWDA